MTDSSDVLVVGYGPVGAALAALLGQRGVRVTVLDRDTEPVPVPRAVATDDEVLRALVRLPGLADLAGQVNGWQRATFVDARLTVLAELPFGDGDLGLPQLSFFHQPSLERQLRKGISELSSVRTLLGRELVALEQDADGVTATLADGATFRTGYAVGCDGSASTVRRLAGIGFPGVTSGEPWLVVDTEVGAPLTALPYFCYVCDPERPAVTMPMPGGHRFEWMLLPGEDPERARDPAHVRALLRRYVDPAAVEVVRAAVYTFHARAAERWRVGRVLLAGDAAHCMPQFAGQGLGAGIRDAVGLGWRLAEVVRGVSPPDLLEDYEAERRPHVAAVTGLALLAGRIVGDRRRGAAAATRTALRGLAATRLLALGDLRPRQGAVLPNPRVRTVAGRVVRLDDVLPAEWAVLSRGDPCAGIDARLAERGAVALAVVPPGGLRTAVGFGAPAVEDLDGTLLRLLRRRRFIVARPDRMLADIGVPLPRRAGAALLRTLATPR